MNAIYVYACIGEHTNLDSWVINLFKSISANVEKCLSSPVVYMCPCTQGTIEK